MTEDDPPTFVGVIDGLPTVLNKRSSRFELWLAREHPDEYAKVREIQDRADTMAEAIEADYYKKRGQRVPPIIVDDMGAFGETDNPDGHDDWLREQDPAVLAVKARYERQLLHEWMTSGTPKT